MPGNPQLPRQVIVPEEFLLPVEERTELKGRPFVHVGKDYDVLSGPQ